MKECSGVSVLRSRDQKANIVFKRNRKKKTNSERKQHLLYLFFDYYLGYGF